MKMEERERLVKKEAIERGLREGRIQGRIQGERIGEERLASLLMNLSKQNRQEDSIKALENLEYRKKFSNKAVKKALTIPTRLNEMAIESNVNFSTVLQEALKKHLGL